MPKVKSEAQRRVSCSLTVRMVRPSLVKPIRSVKLVRLSSTSMLLLFVRIACVLRKARIRRGFGPKGSPTSYFHSPVSGCLAPPACANAHGNSPLLPVPFAHVVAGIAQGQAALAQDGMLIGDVRAGPDRRLSRPPE